MSSFSQVSLESNSSGREEIMNFACGAKDLQVWIGPMDPYKPSFATVIGKGAKPKDELTSRYVTRCLGIDTQNSCFFELYVSLCKAHYFFQYGCFQK